MTGPLHTVNKSPYASSALASCLAHLSDGAALLLIEDGVYAALAESRMAKDVIATLDRHAVYVLEPDLLARGLAGRGLIDGIKPIGYDGFVTLAATHSGFLAWF